MKHIYVERKIKGIVFGNETMAARVLMLRASKDDFGETLSVSDDDAEVMFSVPMRDFRAIIAEVDKEREK